MKVSYEILESSNEKWEHRTAVLKTIEDYEAFLFECGTYFCVSINALYADEKGAEE